MTVKEIFRTIEGIAMLVAFGMVIFTGAKMFAWLGLAAYVIINLPGGIKKFISVIKWIGRKLEIIKA